MRFFTFTRRESQPGSAAYVRELAECMKPNLQGIGPTDAGIAAAALRSYASRWPRRGIALAVAIALVATLGVGLPDLNGDGRVSFADLGIAMMQYSVGAAVTDTRHASAD